MPVFRFGYIILAGIVVLLTLATIVLRKYPLWRSLLLLTCLMILLPPSSGDYRLLMLYPPLMLYVNNQETVKADGWITVIFGLLLIPKAYLVLQSDINIGVLLNPLILMALFVSVLFSPSEKIIM